jgi:hypothetical protein
MKTKFFNILFISIAAEMFAQGGPPPPPGVPIDKDIFLLFIVGTILILFTFLLLIKKVKKA